MKKARNRDFKPVQQKQDYKDPVQLKQFEVTLEECDGDYSKLIRKFMKKVRKHEILKPYYERLMYHMTKSQKRRKKRLKSIYEHKKEAEKFELEDSPENEKPLIAE